MIPVMSHNYEPYSRRFPFWYFIASTNFPSDSYKMLMLCRADSGVCPKDDNGIMSSLTGVLVVFLIIVTIYEAWEFLSSIPLRVTEIFLPLSN